MKKCVLMQVDQAGRFCATGRAGAANFNLKRRFTFFKVGVKAENIRRMISATAYLFKIGRYMPLFDYEDEVRGPSPEKPQVTDREDQAVTKSTRRSRLRRLLYLGLGGFAVLIVVFVLEITNG